MYIGGDESGGRKEILMLIDSRTNNIDSACELQLHYVLLVLATMPSIETTALRRLTDRILMRSSLSRLLNWNA
jgi:hypothetical protein